MCPIVPIHVTHLIRASYTYRLLLTQGCLELYDLKRFKPDSNVTNLSLFLCVFSSAIFFKTKNTRALEC